MKVSFSISSQSILKQLSQSLFSCGIENEALGALGGKQLWLLCRAQAGSIFKSFIFYDTSNV